MKVALVHEFLTQYGGAERVLESFLAIWPDAELHILVHNPDKMTHKFDSHKTKVSFLNKLPFAQTDHKWYLALMPSAVQSFDFKDFDVVLSDSSSFAKGAKTGKVLHICYCHTPTRFLWTEMGDYLKSTKYPYFIKLLAKPVLNLLKKWDFVAAKRPHYFIANSQNVQQRILKYYQRESVVIPPPVDVEAFYPEGQKQPYYFVASRLEPYKKIELVIEAFNELGWELKVAGSGTNSEKLIKLAHSNVEFLGRISDEELRKHYSEAQAYIFPAEEDAGIMVLEAQACGTPVIAYGAGGALETVVPGVTGEFFDQQNSQSLIKVLQNFSPSKYDSAKIREHALFYDKKKFQERIKNFVSEKYAEHAQKGQA